MFGLFKKRTGIDNFSNDLVKYFEKIISKVRQQIGNDKVAFPIIASSALLDAEKEFKIQKQKLAKDYSISEEEVDRIISQTSKAVFDKYFKIGY
ncbi:hypothetical protein ACM39_17160 [Chryseobacterium sp. FH2]|uniref:hypothetical protein n=1 Tax=Chryseobacterium sp. FH2 TaxID=1674291 RepID=UPI00065AD1A1|nr:hypothetical protein [Chryseobacterium sp. FH2]KMQ64253.1 hypothetical protein ACM39_17160 [Chryseobacterium sp. FH2]